MLNQIDNDLQNARFTVALNKIQNNVTKFDEIQNIEKIKFLIRKARILRFSGKISEGIQQIKELYVTFSSDDSLPNKLKSDILIEYAYLLWVENRYDEMHRILDECSSLYIDNTIDEFERQSYINHLEGNFYARKGDLEKALICYSKSYNYRCKSHMDVLHKSIISQNIGYAYYYLSDIEKAEHYFLKSESLASKLDNNQLKCKIFLNLGLVYDKHDNIDKANRYFNLATECMSNIKSIIFLNEVHFYLFYRELQNSNKEETRRHLEILIAHCNDTDNELVKLRTELANGLYIAQSKRLLRKVKGIRKLRKLLNKESLDFELKILAIKHYTRFLIDEYRLYENEETYEELSDILFNLYKYAIGQQRFSIVVESLLLLAKLSFIKEDIDQALIYIDDAELISMRNSLDFDETINRERKNISKYDELKKSKKLNNFSVDELIDQSEVYEYLESVLKVLEKY